MRLNENLILIGDNVALVPYKPEHVPKYHEWMQSPFLQEMTASEPLTLEEEYEMQTSWHQDEEKLTFIVTTVPNESTLSLKNIPESEIKANTVMIGDVNIFFNDPDNDATFGEIEVMIAEPDYRKTGRGREALKMIMCYAIEVIGLKTFQAKISLKNEPSINLFQTKFGFYQVSISKVFEEITLEWTLLEPKTTKATQEQHERILKVYGDLIYYWKTNVKSSQYE